MRVQVDDEGEGIRISELFIGVTLVAGMSEKQMIVCQRDGELLYRTTTDGGKTWTDFREV